MKTKQRRRQKTNPKASCIATLGGKSCVNQNHDEKIKEVRLENKQIKSQLSRFLMWLQRTSGTKFSIVKQRMEKR